MNRFILRTILVVLFSGLIVMLIVRNRQPFGKGNSSFAVEAGKEITRIELAENGKKVSIEKRGGSWFLNGNAEARKSGVLFMIRILRDIRIKSPVSTELFDAEIAGRDIKPVKVRVFDGNRLVKSFIVYRTASNQYGNIMKIKERSKPFIVYLPGYDGEIGSGFTSNELFWKPFTVFNQLPSEIAEIHFENFADSSDSFSIIRHEENFLLKPKGDETAGWDSAMVKRYVSYFAWIPFERWIPDEDAKLKAETESHQPLYRITVITSDRQRKILTLWERYVITDGRKVKDTDRLYGKTGSGEQLFLVRYFDIDPLIKKRSYFFPQ